MTTLRINKRKIDKRKKCMKRKVIVYKKFQFSRINYNIFPKI